MASIRFNIEPCKGNVYAYLFLIYWINPSDRLKYSFKEKIKYKDWDKLRRRPIGSKYADLNLLLNEIENFVYKEVQKAKIEGRVLDSKYLKEALNIRLGLSIQKKINFVSFTEEEIQRRQRDVSFSPSSIKVYRTMLNKVKDYDPGITFDSMSISWINGFKEHLFNKGFQNNYVHKVISTMKAFIVVAYESGIHKNDFFKSSRFNVSKTQSDSIYLTEEEINLFYTYSFKDHYLQNAVNLFLVGCFTGLRFSDLHKVSKDQIQIIEGVEVLRIRAAKTQKEVVLPLHIKLKELLLRDIHPISNQKLNLYIKEAGSIVGINGPIRRTEYPSGIATVRTYKKFELISTHTARRSFATNAYLSGIPSLQIMKLTGHKTESSFLSYIKASNIENAIAVSKSDFFK